LEQGLNLESALFGMVRATEDSTEGLTAFLEKRDPNFRGR
jgi:1,4-dihydroxy-2-naphthoyl-CoA synthase